MKLICVCCGDTKEVADDLTVGDFLPVAEWWGSVARRCARCRADARQPILDRAEGERRRDESMVQVDEHADPDWKTAAKTMLKTLAAHQEFVTSDDLWASGLPKPREPRAAGPIFRWAATHGLIEDSGRTILTAQANSHRAPIRVWRSLICE